MFIDKPQVLNESRNRLNRLKEQIIKTIEGQNIARNIFERELIQNGKDAGSEVIEINEYIRSNRFLLEHVLEFTDFVGMDETTLFDKLLFPGRSNKRLKEGTIGGFGIGFWTVFQYSDKVEIETEKNSIRHIVRLELVRDKSGNILDISIKHQKLLIPLNNSNNHTSIRLISPYNERVKIIKTLEYFNRRSELLKMVGGNIIRNKSLWEEEKVKEDNDMDVIEQEDIELNKNKENNKKIKIRYNRKRIIKNDKKRILVSEIKMDKPKGNLKIYLNPVKISSIEKDGLYVNEIKKEWLAYVPDVVKDSLKGYMDRVIIQWPTTTKMTLQRHDANNFKEKENLKKAIALGLMKALVNLYMYRGINIVGLSEDSLYSSKDIEKEIKIDSKYCVNGAKLELMNFKKYLGKENRQNSIKLLFLLKPNKKDKSLYKFKKDLQKQKKVKVVNFSNGFKDNIEYAKQEISSKKEKETRLKVKGNEVLENVRYFLLGLKGLTGIGFEYIEFYEAKDGTEASCVPHIDGYRLKLNNKYLSREFERINEAFKNNKSIEEVIFKLGRGSFLETIIHEAAHREEFKIYTKKGLESFTQWTHGKDEVNDESFSSLMEQLIGKLLLSKIKDTKEIILYGKMIKNMEEIAKKINFEKVIDVFVKNMEKIFQKEGYEKGLENYGVDKLKYLLKAA